MWSTLVSATTEVGSDLWRSFGPIPLVRQGCLQPGAHDCTQASFEYPQGWRENPKRPWGLCVSAQSPSK